MHMLPPVCSKNEGRGCHNLLAYRWAFEWAFNDTYTQQIVIVLKMKVSQISKGKSHNAHFKTLVSVLHLPERLKRLLQSNYVNPEIQYISGQCCSKKNTCKYSEHASHHKNPSQNSNQRYVPNALHPETGLFCGSETSWKPITMKL